MTEADTAKTATLPFKDLFILLPLLASALAFAFNVGYFSALDVDYFSFFSLSEHIVFSLQGLPLAIILAMVVGAYFMLFEQRMRNWWSLEQPLRVPAGYLLAGTLIPLGVGFTYIGLSGLGMACHGLGFIAFAAGVAPRPAETIGVLLVPTIVMVSWGAGNDMASDKRFRPDRTHVLRTATGDVEGTLIAAGERGILFQFASTKEIGVVRWDGVKQITTKEKRPRTVPWIRRPERSGHPG